MRLYTADAIKEQVHKLLCKDCTETDVCPVCDYRELIDEILDAPTVDAEPVVRCKDCIYQTECAFTEWLGRNGNGFCSSGERK